ncbi:MAG: hypothetical protein J5858_01710, partial [Lentisphaeria bacterium]|nr:hypothetical protein [Lentisphaeria bacterium]
MSRKKNSGLETAVKRAAGNAARRAVKSAARKEVKKVLRKIPLKYQLLTLLIILSAVVGTSFIPEKQVPRALEKPHTFLLTWRNRLIRMSRLPVSCYDDTHILPNPGTDPIQIFFAPSPKIASALCRFIRSAARSVDVCAFDLKLD